MLYTVYAYVGLLLGPMFCLGCALILTPQTLTVESSPSWFAEVMCKRQITWVECLRCMNMVYYEQLRVELKGTP